MSKPSCPDPGVYEKVSFADYAAWDAVNNSRLGAMAVSPRHYLHPRQKDSSGFALGSLSHTAWLESTTLAERYAVLPRWEEDEQNVTSGGVRSDSKSTNYYKQKLAAFDEANRDVEIVSRDQYAAMRAIVESLEADAKTRDLIHEKGATELSIVWEDPDTGLRCKGRIDKVCPASGRMADLKTTGNLPRFSRSIADYGYHRQQAFYRYGWAVLNGGELLTPWIAAVESSAPYAVMTAPLSSEAIEVGESEFRRLLDRVAECHESGSWPGPEAPEEWELPEWARPKEPVALTIGGAAIEVA